MATIVSYSGEDLHNMSVAMESAGLDISTVNGEVEASFGSTGISGTAGTDIQVKLDDAIGKLGTLQSDVNKIFESLSADIQADQTLNTAVNDIYAKGIDW